MRPANDDLGAAQRAKVVHRAVGAEELRLEKSLGQQGAPERLRASGRIDVGGWRERVAFGTEGTQQGEQVG
jgi:hypothetical protein